MPDPDEPYDPDRWLIDWTPYEPPRAIICDCGHEFTLSHLFNMCPCCGQTYDRWGHRWGGKPPEQG